MNFLKARICFILFVVVEMNRICYAQVVDDIKWMTSFADELCAAGDYDAAILEYKRVMHYDIKTIDSVLIKLADCYYMNKQYNMATIKYKEILGNITNRETKYYCEFQLGKCLMKNNQTLEAVELLTSITADTSSSYQNISKYYLGYIYATKNDWTKASHWLAIIESGDIRYERAKILSEQVLEGYSLPQKSSLFAGILSGVLPGAGYWYSGHGKIAIASAILNALFIAGAYESYQKDLYAVGTSFAVIGSGWYLGNIFGSMNKARQYNRHMRRGFVYRLEFNL